MHHSEQKQFQAPSTLIASQEDSGPRVSLQTPARGAVSRRCGSGEAAPRTPAPLALAKPQPSAFQQKKMFF